MPNIHTPSKVVLSKESIKPTTWTADSSTTHGTWVDCQGARVAMVDVSAPCTAGTTVTFTIDDSADQITINSDVAGNEFAVIAQTGPTGTQIVQPGHQVMSINLAKRQRYIRVTQVNAGGITGASCARVLLFNETYLFDSTAGDAIGQDNADVVNT